MKTNRLLLAMAGAGFFIGCAAVPKELVHAREAYRRVSAGPAAQAAPAEVHVANQALAHAEQSFKDNPRSYLTRDLAYVAQRKAEIAEATASIYTEKQDHAQAKSDYQATQGVIITKTKEDLSKSRTALAESESKGEMTAERLSAEQQARVAADQRAATAQAALADLAAVKEEERGMVISLSGSVLFASNLATLLPEARDRLDRVADVLLMTRERYLTVEGYTDSQGSERHNLDLSQRRANAVRSLLVERGYEPDRVQARGFGEGHPIADNNSAEGRANNRRVEIIIENKSYTSHR